MKDVEARLRDALRAAAETVDDTRPRPLPGGRPLPVPDRRWSAGHRRLTPVLAAAAIVVLVAGVVGVRAMVAGPERRPVQQRVGAMPRFLVTSVLAGGGQRSRLEIRDSGTGRVLDAEPADAGVDFREVAAAADNRTFFAITERRSAARCRIAVDRVSVSDSGIITQRDPVAGADVAGTVRESGGLAVSPNGKWISYGVGGCPETARGESGVGLFGIIRTDTGKRVEWPDRRGGTYRAMSWSGDGRYLFFVRVVQGERVAGGAVERQELRRIDIAAHTGDEVELASTLIRGVDAPRTLAGTAAGRDGREVTVSESGPAPDTAWSGPSTAAGRAEVEPSPTVPFETGTLRADEWTSSPMPADLLRISVADGRVLRAARQRGAVTFGHPLLKGDPSGRYLLTDLGTLDTASGGAAHPIAGLTHVFDADW